MAKHWKKVVTAELDKAKADLEQIRDDIRKAGLPSSVGE